MAASLQRGHATAVRWGDRPEGVPTQVWSYGRSKRRGLGNKKAFIRAVKGSAHHWYTSIPKGHIHSWGQLRSKLLSSFQGLKTEELTSCDFHNCNCKSTCSASSKCKPKPQMWLTSLSSKLLPVGCELGPLRTIWIGPSEFSSTSCMNTASQTLASKGELRKWTKRRRWTNGRNRSTDMQRPTKGQGQKPANTVTGGQHEF